MLGWAHCPAAAEPPPVVSQPDLSSAFWEVDIQDEQPAAAAATACDSKSKAAVNDQQPRWHGGPGRGWCSPLLATAACAASAAESVATRQHGPTATAAAHQ